MQDVLFLIGWWLFIAVVIMVLVAFAAYLIYACYPDDTKAWWQHQTMSLGLWLIGGRETPNYRSERLALCDQLRLATEERDEARAASDRLRNERDISDRALKALNESATEDMKKLERKYTLLRNRYNTLRDRIVAHPFKITPKRKPAKRNPKK